MYSFSEKSPEEKGLYIMKTVNGICTSAKIFTDSIENYALAQIRMLCDDEAFRGSKIRIMPDVHPGKVGTIGFTATVGKRILPNVVGIDIGCGVTIAKLKQKKIEYQKLDTVIRENIPSGYAARKKAHHFKDQIELEELNCYRQINRIKAETSLGTLGGGNHFIEVDQDDQGAFYVVIHSGSRHLGKDVTDYYLREGQKKLKGNNISVPYELTYLEGELRTKYLYDIRIVQEYAALNREAILDELMKGMKWKVTEIYSSMHNYIAETNEGLILRKGAVSALKNETVIIPVNMKDGVILGIGKGNADWNYSAPHGAGRILKREDVKQKYTVSAFKSVMKGIYSSCIGKETLDEAPFAYRSLTEIETLIKDTLEIRTILRPVYNYKAGKE